MEPVKLKSELKEYIWAGEKLPRFYGKDYGPKKVAESWELSFNASGPSVIDSGKDKGKLLKDVATPKDIGVLAAKFQFFPVLIKLIDSDSDLSVQVHPSDKYALQNEGQFGKTEMWHVLEAKEGAGLYVGWKRKTNPEEVRKAIEDGSIVELMNFVEVKPGDNFFIESGTVHAIGAGVTLIEIQENSTLTYRLYDYNRVGKDGKKRELHVEKALKVLSYDPYKSPKFKEPLIGKSEYFESSAYYLNGLADIQTSEKSFKAITFVTGEGSFNGVHFKKGDSFFIPASSFAHIEGVGDYILTEVGE